MFFSKEIIYLCKNFLANKTMKTSLYTCYVLYLCFSIKVLEYKRGGKY